MTSGSMYSQFFQLSQPPFSIAPDPRYLFMSERHREALAHLLYGVGSGGGFVLLTGEIGAGKTTVCRCFIEQIPANCKLAYIFNPKLSVTELLLSICDEFGIAVGAAGDPAGRGASLSVKAYVDAINAYLLYSHARGLNNVLVIDEAQNLSADVLEQLRLLTNLETSERKLLQIILIGQPELRTMLARPELEQLAQRVIARYHLGSLSPAETASYIAHRLAVAGAGAAQPFPRAVMALIHRLTGGVPRRINLLCDRALLGAYVENAAQVSRPILRRAGAEVFGAAAQGSRRWPLAAGALLAAAGALLAAAVAGALLWQLQLQRQSPPRALAPVVAQRAASAKVAAPAAGAVTATAATAPTAPTAPTAARPAAAPATAATPAYGSIDDAMPELASLWGVSLPAAASCQQALKQNLRCYSGKGGLYDLRLLDRPAILTLHDGAKTGYVVLVGLTDNIATLRMHGVTEQMGIAALAARFDGQYTTLWSAPRGFRDEVRGDEVGADADWIAAQLAQLNDAPPPPLGQAFDSATRARLRQFQRQQNLKADGVAGPRTYMRLNQLSAVTEPRLLPAKPGGR